MEKSCQESAGRWSRVAVPGVPDLVFGLVLLTVLAGGRTGLLNDPGTFWHLRLGARSGATATFHGSIP